MVRMGFGVLLGRVLSVLMSQDIVAMCDVGMVCGLFMIPCLMGLVSFMVMMSCPLMVFCGMKMVRMICHNGPSFLGWREYRLVKNLKSSLQSIFDL